jgi:DNA sulfur modification protein DndC
MNMRQTSLFEDMRLTLEDAISMSVASLREYGRRYGHWVIAYSGGKDSSATVILVAWAIREGLIPRPESITVQYADTRQEYPVLYGTAVSVLNALERDGLETMIVTPEMDDRFYVYMLGYGVPPPSNTFRWCTDKLKISPMTRAMAEKRESTGEKFLLINGVRLGESDARDQRIAVSCSKDSGECGQGWFEVKPPDSAGDTLAPLLHWRVCHVFDWLYFSDHRHGYPEVTGIADVYGDEDVRTGCIGCNLASRDVALERLISLPQYNHLSPLLELRGLFAELKKPHNRLRKAYPERRKDGQWSKNGQRMGPLTMDARAWGLDRVLSIQERASVDLINAEEEARIREMWSLNMWPQKWTGTEVGADVPIDAISVVNGKIITQPLLVR